MNFQIQYLEILIIEFVFSVDFYVYLEFIFNFFEKIISKNLKLI